MPAESLSPEYQEILRCFGRGGILDVHHREQGYTCEIGPTALGVITDRDRRGDLLQLQAKEPSNTRTLVLNVNVRTIRDGSGSAPPLFRAQLELRWGAGKGVARAFVDLRRGLQLVIPASTVTAGALYLDDAIGAGPRLEVSASVGYGCRPGQDTALTFTEASTGALGVGAVSASFAIPAYATRVCWQSPSSPVAFVVPDALLEFLATPVDGVVTMSNPARDAFVPIPEGANFIRITNLGAGGTPYHLLHELSI